MQRFIRLLLCRSETWLSRLAIGFKAALTLALLKTQLEQQRRIRIFCQTWGCKDAL